MIDCDPDALVEAAKCFRCIPEGMTLEVWIYLICQWLERTRDE